MRRVGSYLIPGRDILVHSGRHGHNCDPDHTIGMLQFIRIYVRQGSVSVMEAFDRPVFSPP